MPHSPISQYYADSLLWKTSIGRLADENIAMKTQLAEILKNDFDVRWLPEVEKLYNLVLTEESWIHLLRHNISELEKWTAHKSSGEPGSMEEVLTLHTTLQHQMKSALDRVHRLKEKFSLFLTDMQKASL